MVPEEKTDSKQCPACGSWDVRSGAAIEEGGIGDWCPHCKKSLQKMSSEPKIEGRVRLLGWLQLIASGILFIQLFSLAIQGQLNIYTFLFSVFAIGLNFFAGYLSIKKKVLGYWLSIVIQSLQTISFTVTSYIYRYSGIGGVYVLLLTANGEMRLGLNASIKPGFNIVWGVNLQRDYFALDILAVFFIGVLLSALDFVKRESI